MVFFNKIINLILLPIKLFIFVSNKLRYKYFGNHSYINKPLRIDGSKNIYIGNNVFVGYKSWLAAVPLTQKKAELIIEAGCILGNFNHIYATESIIIHENVLTADKVYISDNLHGYEDIKTPIMYQSIIQKRKVEIGKGTWIGENVCIIGAKIGNHCVIGANSVVTNDIPDYCVAVGAPAKVIKRYDFLLKKWIKV